MAIIVLYFMNRTAQTTARLCFFPYSSRVSIVDSRISFFHNTSVRRLTPLPGARWVPKATGVRFMSNGTAGKSATGRTRSGALLVAGAAAAVVGFVASASHFQRAEMATMIPKTEETEIAEKCKKFMSPPCTNVKMLQQKKEEMCTRMEMLIMETQAEFCRALEEVDGGKFKVDKWERKEGKYRSLLAGAIWKEPSPNCCHKVGRTELSRMSLHSVVLRFPSYHSSVGAEIMNDGSCLLVCVCLPGTKQWWFGGGTDLTPTYVNKEDGAHFHNSLKEACDKHHPKYYPDFKKWCDRYFYIRHRGETRGIGGIFFDDLDSPSQEEAFSFVRSCAQTVVPCYLPIVYKHLNDPFSPEEKDWQQVRRGRYVEFNLVYDRGVKFGLATPGSRIESILMALPLTANEHFGEK
uniref:coproporphyrinogen oxidase n=1 Tax=Hucho hucho TaxID=62062 RepID=A0A4W5P657_9TELE